MKSAPPNVSSLPKTRLDKTAQLLAVCAREIEEALQSNPRCSTGMMISQQVLAIPDGPFGGPEILVPIYADDPSFQYWYGHIVPHPTKLNTFASLIVWSEHVINAPTLPLQFARFHYWMAHRHCYHPCSTQNRNDAYAEGLSLEQATELLKHMILCFSLEKRIGEEGGMFSDSTVELRILDIYGLEDNRGEDGCWDMPPMPNDPVFLVDDR